MPVAKWKNLCCLGCGGETFLTLRSLRHHPTGGLTHEEVGLRCAQCQTNADPKQMLARLRHHELLAELTALESEAAALDAAVPASCASSNGSPTTPPALSSKRLSTSRES